jgi:hypothetical protein
MWLLEWWPEGKRRSTGGVAEHLVQLNVADTAEGEPLISMSLPVTKCPNRRDAGGRRRR